MRNAARIRTRPHPETRTFCSAGPDLCPVQLLAAASDRQAEQVHLELGIVGRLACIRLGNS